MIFANVLIINYVPVNADEGKKKNRAALSDVRTAFWIAAHASITPVCLCYGNCKALSELYIRNPIK